MVLKRSKLTTIVDKGVIMPETKLIVYVSRTRAYLASDRGRADFRRAQEKYGYSYQRALACAVMTATGIRIYERITAVVDAMMAVAV
jgi:hypothetical protein